MSKFKDKLNQFIGQKVVIKDITNAKAGYTIQEVGEDYILADQNKNVRVVFNLDNIVSIARSETLARSTKKMSKEKVDKEWDSMRKSFQKKAKKVK